MKKNLYIVTGLCALSMALGACHKDKAVTPTDPNTGEVFSIVGDQVGRPGIATVFVPSGAPRDVFNATIPSVMNAQYKAQFEGQLIGYNSGYTKNILGLDTAGFAGVLATDVLNVSTTGKTTYYDGTNVLTGRALSDDVITVSLTLIFGGPTGASNPGLTSDNVPANDKAFLTSFPYEASPW